MEGNNVNTANYIASIERIIREHQQVQMANPPTSKPWQDASEEINRLASLIVDAAEGATILREGLSIGLVRYRDGSRGAIRATRMAKCGC
jgi:hypothetical protein